MGRRIWLADEPSNVTDQVINTVENRDVGGQRMEGFEKRTHEDQWAFKSAEMIITYIGSALPLDSWGN